MKKNQLPYDDDEELFEDDTVISASEDEVGVFKFNTTSRRSEPMQYAYSYSY